MKLVAFMHGDTASAVEMMLVWSSSRGGVVISSSPWLPSGIDVVGVVMALHALPVAALGGRGVCPQALLRGRNPIRRFDEAAIVDALVMANRGDQLDG